MNSEIEASTVCGLILAAGRGSRMGAATEALPKCMSELAGATLLEWQISALRAAGVPRVELVVGYLGETIADRADGHHEAPRWSETNMVGSLVSASERLRSSTCLVSYSDIAFHPSHVEALVAADPAAGIALTYDVEWQSLWEARFEDPLSDAETFREEDGVLLEIGASTSDMTRVQGQYMGLLRFRPEGWAQVQDLLSTLPPDKRDRLDMTALLALLLAVGVRIAAVPVVGRWVEVDTVSDRDRYEALLDQDRWAHDWRW